MAARSSGPEPVPAREPDGGWLVVLAELDAAAAHGPRHRDAVCEEIAARLVEERVVPDFQLRSSDLDSEDADTELVCADRYWRRRFLAQPSVATAVECGRWLRGHAGPGDRRALRVRWGLGYGFITSDVRETEAEIAHTLRAAPDDRDELNAEDAFLGLLYVAGKLRAGYMFAALGELLESPNRLLDASAGYGDEPILVALRAMAAFGIGQADRGMTLLDQVWVSPPTDREVTDVALNGLAAAAPFKQQPERLRQHAAEAVAAWPRDHVFRYRSAMGRRLCGDYDAALDAINKALALLPAVGTRISHQLLREQYMQERERIASAATQPHQQLPVLVAVLASRAAPAAIAPGVAGMSFLGVALALTVTAPDWGQRLVVLAIAGLGLAVFAGLTVVGARLALRAERTSPTGGTPDVGLTGSRASTQA